MTPVDSVPIRIYAVSGRRNYKAMSAQRFWEEIGKEMKGNG